MKRSISLLMASLAAVALAGCQTLSFGKKYTTIESIPVGATVSIEGYGECETPCTIQHDVVRTIVVAKAGYLPQKFNVSPGAGKVRVRLELAAPTEGVDQQTLPDL